MKDTTAQPNEACEFDRRHEKLQLIEGDYKTIVAALDSIGIPKPNDGSEGVAERVGTLIGQRDAATQKADELDDALRAEKTICGMIEIERDEARKVIVDFVKGKNAYHIQEISTAEADRRYYAGLQPLMAYAERIGAK